jgi:hypothetical protein
MRQLLGPTLVVTAEDFCFATVDSTHHPVAVELDFVNPLVPGRCFLRQGRELHIDPARHRQSLDALQVGRNLHRLLAGDFSPDARGFDRDGRPVTAVGAPHLVLIARYLVHVPA